MTSPHALVVVNSFLCVDSLAPFPPPCLPKGEYPGTRCPHSFQHRMGERTVYLLILVFAFFCGGDEFTCGFCSMELLLGVWGFFCFL